MKLFIMTAKMPDTWIASAFGVPGVVAQGKTEVEARLECQKMLISHRDVFPDAFEQAKATAEVGLSEFTINDAGGATTVLLYGKKH